MTIEHNVTFDGVLAIGALDKIARDALGGATSGVSVGNNSTIHLLTDSTDNRATCQAIFDNWGTLSVTADKTTMTEGDADPVISCSDGAINADTDIGYVVLLDGVQYASGTDTVSAGVADLTLESPVAGVYDVFVYRLSDTHASGSVKITVSEV